MKLKIKPSTRINRRYILIQSSDELGVKEMVLEYLGILGWAKAAPIFIKSEKNIILAVNRKSLEDVRAAFEISESHYKILRVSGTLKSLQKD